MSVFTREGLRKSGNVADWSQITSIPQRILEVAALGDPGGLRWLIWDDSLNEIGYLEPLAEFVEYDNSISGLSAVDVQAAIDEIVATNIPSYDGVISATGTFTAGPSGWSSGLAANVFTLTHNLGHTDYGVQLTCWHPGGDRLYAANIQAKNANTVTYIIASIQDTTSFAVHTIVEFKVTLF